MEQGIAEDLASVREGAWGRGVQLWGAGPLQTGGGVRRLLLLTQGKWRWGAGEGGWAKEGTDAGDLGYMECTGLGWDGDTGGVRDDTWKMLSIGGDMSSLGK